MGDEDEASLSFALPGIPGFQPVMRKPRKLARCDPIVAAPVVGKAKEILAFGNSKIFQYKVCDFSVSIDLPFPRKHMEVRHQRISDDVVAKILTIGIVVG